MISPPEPLPAFNDNYIWWLPATPGPLLVDPGEAAPVLQRFADAPALAGILLTHHHPDHVGGVPELLQRWPDTPVIAPHDERITHATRRVADGDRVALGGHEFEVLAVPGHTRSHIAYFGEGLLFCGDTLFSMGCGRMFEGDAPTMLASLDRLAALPGSTRVCCAHEYTLANGTFAEAVMPGQPALLARMRQARQQREAGIATLPSTVEDERATNPFLRIDDAQVRASIADHFGQAPGDRNAAFAALRAWKDGFKG